MDKLNNTDLTVSNLCLGANVFGWTADEIQSHHVLDAFTTGGGNFIDTADVYGGWIPEGQVGDSERFIGTWLKNSGMRRNVVIATKVGKLEGRRGLSPANINAALDDSLERLQTDYIDIYYAHEDDQSVPLEESLGAFDAAVKSGKVRYIAASNFSGERLAEALKISEREGFAKFVAVQNHYNLVERSEYESDMAPVVEANGLASVPYFSLAMGFLTGKYRDGGAPVDSPRADGAARYLDERGRKVLDALDGIATDREVAVATISLAWLLSKPGIASTIASARNTDQLRDLMAVQAVDLRPDEVALLDEASA